MLMRTVFVTSLVAAAVIIVWPLTSHEGAHAALDGMTHAYRFTGDQLLGLDLTAPRQNMFSLVRDIVRTPEIVDHSSVYRSRMLGFVNFLSRGRIRTIADALRWFDVPLTAHQARSLDLCKPLTELATDEVIVVQPDPFQHGVASWYGPGFHGRLAASGEIYSMYDLTAAHRTLPLQSMVRVVSQRTGASTVVRINDRGPYVGGRIIDMSRRAMDLIGGGELAAVYLEKIDTGALDIVCP